jgi:primosomal protein N' (replication factor Y)
MIASPPTTSTFLRVAVPSPVRHLFDYLAPLNSNPLPGMRVMVPFGTRTLQGIIVELSNHSAIPNLKPAIELVDIEPLFNSKQMELFKWASSYYHYPLGMLFAAVIPSWLRKHHSLDPIAQKTMLAAAIPELILNPEQEQAINKISDTFNSFAPFLLDGITGSGKTEVYMQLIARVIAENKQALVLVPEINLTPQTLARFQERFQVPIAMLHSQVAEKQRASNWLLAQQGVAPIILGTRLAAFTPMRNPGIFIIDEEHDLSFKQQDRFRYSARDLLLKRAQLEQCPVVLGTATPSLETWHNVQTLSTFAINRPRWKCPTTKRRNHRYAA